MKPASIPRASSFLRYSRSFAITFGILLTAGTFPSSAAVPQLLNHQGRIAVNGTNFEGTGQFKFALVNTTGTTTYWSNDNSSTAGSEPAAAVSLPVLKGLYAVLLGDAGMTALPTTVFDNTDVRLRVWFNDGTLGFQHITPDQRLVSAPFALNAAKAETVSDGSITSSKLATDLMLSGTTTGTFVGDGSGLTGVHASRILLEDVIAPPIRPVIAWGDNHDGQTSIPPTLINANTAAIAAGGGVGVALLKTGTVVQWGTGTAVPGGLANVTHVAAGAAHRLACKSDGTVTAWGDNTFGQSTVPGGLNAATNVAAGEKHSLALLADGTLQAWGDNTFGQTTIPGTATNVAAIACGYDHSLALKADGTVVAWGRNDSDQSTVPGGLTNVVAIACGAYHSLAVKSDGTVVAWGWDVGSQVAGATGLTGISKVAGGYAYSLALKNDGTLVAWGDNFDGQTLIPADAVNVTAVAAGPSYALALRADLIPAQVARLDQDNFFTAKVGIQRAPAVNALEVEGQASKTTAGNWLANSDRRIKDNVKPITGALEKLSQVRLVDFKYTADYIAAHPGIEDKRYLNVIAQEFAEVFPEDVKSSGETLPDGSPILQVDTYPLTIYSAAAVQELARENATLKKQLADQEERLKKLEALIK